jgi:beta-lactamase class A
MTRNTAWRACRTLMACCAFLMPASAVSQASGEVPWSALSASLEPLVALANASDIRLSIGVQDLSGHFEGGRLLLGSADLYHPASTIKMLLIATLMRKVDEGEHSLTDRVVVNEEDIVGGFGVLRQEAIPQEVSLRRLAELTVTISDNTATNVLVDVVGYSAMQETVQKLGLDGMQFGRKMFEAASPPDRENYIGAADTLTLLMNIHQGTFLSEPSRNQILTWMRAQTVKSKIAAGVPAGTPIAHKTGENGPVSHDIGYLLLPGREVAIAVFAELGTSNDFETAQSVLNPVVAEVATRIHQHLIQTSD